MKKKIDLNVEALRGFCSIVVVLHHCLFANAKLNPKFNLQSLIGGFVLPGHLMVLIFFMLSGYVIGLSYLQKDNFNIFEYLKRRLIRLYPIYLIAIVVTIIFFHESQKAVVSTIAFAQNLLSNNLKNNTPLWSLNHEIIYYLLIIPVLKFRIKLKYIFLAASLLLTFSIVKMGLPAIIEGYIVGFIFWLTGFYISSVKLKQKDISSTLDTNKFLSLLFILLSADVINIFHSLFSHIKILHGTSYYNASSNIRFEDFAYFIYCFYAIITATSTKIKYSTLLTVSTYLCSWGMIVIWLLNGTLASSHFFYISALFLLFSTIIFFIKKPLIKSVSYLQYSGSVSYSIYVLHAPMLFLIGNVHLFTGSLLTFLLRTALLVFVTVSLSHFLEKVVQPMINDFFYKRNRVIKPI